MRCALVNVFRATETNLVLYLFIQLFSAETLTRDIANNVCYNMLYIIRSPHTVFKIRFFRTKKNS